MQPGFDLPHLDTATFLLCIGILGFLMAGISFALDRSLPDRVRGIRELCIAMIGAGLGFTLLGLRGHVSEFLTFFVGNVAAIATALMLLVSTSLLVGHRLSLHFVWALFGICTVALLFSFVALRHDDTFRVLAISTPAAAAFLYTGAITYASPWARRRSSSMLSCASFVVFGAVLTWRVAMVFLGGGQSIALYAHTGIQAAFLIATAAAAVTVSIASLMMAAERIREGVLIKMDQRTLEATAAQRKLHEEEEHRRQLEVDIVSMLESEQRKLGRILHDGLSQKLSAIGFVLEHFRVALTRDQAPPQQDVERLQTLVAEAAAQTRVLSKDLNSGLSDERIGVVLHELAERLQRIDRLDCFLDCDKGLLLADRDLERHFYQIASAAVTRAIAAQGVSFVRIRLRATAKRLRLMVSSDHAPHAIASANLDDDAFKVMSHRAALANATLQIRSWRSGGTTVVATKRISDPATT